MEARKQKTPKTASKKSRAMTNSVDTYAAQCENCVKWRVIPTQEEYEDIRSKLTEKPFVCERKPGVSCEDPADIEYDASRTWVIDRPDIPKTPEGFQRSLVLRKDYSKMDAYYITPAGKKLKMRKEVESFIEANEEYKGLSLSEFNFNVPKVMEETIPANVIKKDHASGDGNKRNKTPKKDV